jgi:hypothetical protein
MLKQAVHTAVPVLYCNKTEMTSAVEFLKRGLDLELSKPAEHKTPLTEGVPSLSLFTTGI